MHRQRVQNMNRKQSNVVLFHEGSEDIFNFNLNAQKKLACNRKFKIKYIVKIEGGKKVNRFFIYLLLK